MSPGSLLAAAGLDAPVAGLSPVEYVRRRLDDFETAVKVTVAIELTARRDRGNLPEAARSALVRSLARPSLGHWIEFHRHVRGDPDWITPLEEEHHLVRLRNLFAHTRPDGLAAAPDVLEAVEAAAAAIRSAAVLNRPAAEARAEPLLYWADGRLLIYQSFAPRTRAPLYTTRDTSTPVRLDHAAGAFAQRFPLARWQRRAVEPLGDVAGPGETPLGRDSERLELAGFLRGGDGILLLEADAGQGKTSLLRAGLRDLQGLSLHGPPLPAVAAEPVAVAYFIRRGTASARPSAFLDGLLAAVSRAYGLPVPPAASFDVLLQRLARIEADESVPPLALLIDALDESPPIAAYVPAGGPRVRVAVSVRAGAGVVPTAPWRTAVRQTIRLTGLDAAAVAELTGGTPEDARALYAASGGNPLYLRFAVTAGLTGEKPPAGLDALFGTIMARLPDAAGPALRLLAELAEPVPPATIAALLDRPAEQLRPVLDPRTNPFVREDGGWSVSHDLARGYLVGGPYGRDVPDRLRALILTPASYSGPAAGPLTRQGVRLLGPDAAQLGPLLPDDRRLDHQSAESLLADADRVYGGDVPDAFAAFVRRHSAIENGRLGPEHLQNVFLAGRIEALYPALLASLTDEAWAAEDAELPRLAFRYARANLDRRTLEPDRMARARETLTGSLRLIPAGSADHRYDREHARIRYDLGYLAYLAGDYDEAIEQLGRSADAAGAGDDQIGVWAARALIAEFLFEARRIPGWLAQAGLRRAAERFAALPPDTPHAARWVRGLHEHGFDIAFRVRATADAQAWYDALQDDAQVRQAVRIGTSTLAGARWLMLTDRWAEAAAMLEPAYASARTRWTEGVARELLDLGVALWRAGDRLRAREVWRYAAGAPGGTGNDAWRAVARRLLTDQPTDPWGW